MTENILISIAWPYANAEIHVGNITGSHLPGDIIARYHRLKGRNVAMVSGTDSHGTPVTLRAESEGLTNEAVYKRFHEGFLELFQGMGISYDMFTTTHTDNHFKVSQAIFLALKENGHLYTKTSMQWYSPSAQRFLPDRYVEGACYICGAEGARSDQCDHCGNVLEPAKLKNPKAKTGDALELRETEHFYLDLSQLEPKVANFLRERSAHMRETVLGESLGKIEAEGLLPRPITRDLDWGIPVPVDDEDWAGKCLYVWFEAVIGYLSSPIEMSKVSGEPDAWKSWWTQEARQFYFIGKDNIFFHTALWPAELMGAGEKFPPIFSKLSGLPEAEPEALTLPYDVPANQFMNLEGQKISGSRNWAVWGRDALTRYDPDALRYYLTVNMPESKDSDWDWAEFVAHNNNELVANWGNLANRVLSFCYKHWEGQIPDVPFDEAQGTPTLRDADLGLLAAIDDGFNSVGDLLEAVKIRAALAEAMRLATEVNKYLDTAAPWKEIKEDKAEAAKTVYTALRAIDSLKVIFAPFLPFTSEQLNKTLGCETPLFGQQFVESIEDSLGTHTALRYKGVDGEQWKPSELKPGAAFNQPSPLFKKLDKRVVEEERARLS